MLDGAGGLPDRRNTEPFMRITLFWIKIAVTRFGWSLSMRFMAHRILMACRLPVGESARFLRVLVFGVGQRA